MARRRIRPDSKEDLNQIWTFVAVNNPKAGDAMIDRLTEAFEMLLTMPLAGRARPEFGENLRSFVVDNHVVFYETVPEGIDIVRIMHGRRNFEPHDLM
jgi:toxin ParE1/3/4